MQIHLKRCISTNSGRVGRKQEAPTGMVLFLHEGVSISMLMAKKILQE